jgi:hypothetical protein
MWAMMLSIRREGPELAEEKKTSRGWASSGKGAPVEGLSHYARQAATPKPLADVRSTSDHELVFAP